MINIKKILIIIISGFFIMNTSQVFAIKKAIYPTINPSIQSPIETRPNISGSGNVSSTTENTINNEQESNNQTSNNSMESQTNTEINNEQVNNTDTVSNNNNVNMESLKIPAIIFGIVVLFLFFLYRKLKNLKV
jgi:hypothetical protein